MTKRDLVADAQHLLARNLQIGTVQALDGEYEYKYICPSRPKYPHQWLWDSSFHAIVTGKFFSVAAACRELETLLHGIHSDGLLPSIIYWDGEHGLTERLLNRIAHHGFSSNLTQPPVVALALEHIFHRPEANQVAQGLLAAVERYFSWLEEQRDPDKDGLVSIIHPWEGLDASPVFDSVLQLSRPSVWDFYRKAVGLIRRYAAMNWDMSRVLASAFFDVEDVLFNCVYAEGLRSISRMEHSLGNPSEARRYAHKADRVEEAILKTCWNSEDQIFYDVSGPEHRFLKIKSVSSLFPIILENIPRTMLDTIVLKHLTNEDEFWTTFPIPSVARNEPRFDPADASLTWRGPTWINTNWFIARGLAKHGYTEYAKEIAKRTIALVDSGGYWEFYNPITGKPGGQASYSWSTLTIDLVDVIGLQNT